MAFNHDLCIRVSLYFGDVSEKVGIISSRNELERISIMTRNRECHFECIIIDKWLTQKEIVADFYLQSRIEIFETDITFENQVCCDWLAMRNSPSKLDS